MNDPRTEGAGPGGAGTGHASVQGPAAAVAPVEVGAVAPVEVGATRPVAPAAAAPVERVQAAPSGMVPAASAESLRRALGRFATGVTIVTCRSADGLATGLTANSFNALSLEPPLVLWSLRRSSSSIDAFQASSHFAVNVLAADQVDLSRHFARPSSSKFDAGDWTDGEGGAPVLAGCVAVFECRLQSHQLAGDHVLFIGEVLRLSEADAVPLVYHAGHYRTLAEPA